MPNYQTKPILCDAFCWEAEVAIQDRPNWLQNALSKVNSRIDGGVEQAGDQLEVQTIHGKVKTAFGDWIVYWSHTNHKLEIFTPDDFIRKFDIISISTLLNYNR